MSFRHLPGAFLEIFFWFQKATLGTRLPLKPSRRARLLPGALGGPAACPVGRFLGNFLLVSESDVRHEAAFKTLPAP